jgi:hypothetical protein
MLAILKITVHVAVEPLSSCDNRSAFNTARKLERPLLAQSV